MAAKSAVFFSPILLSSQIPLKQYGVFESTLALAMLLGTAVAFGTPAAAPFFRLKQYEPNPHLAAIFHCVALSVAFLACSVVALYLNYEKASLLLILVSHVLLQRILQAEYAARGNPVASSFFSSYFYLVILTVVLIYWYTGTHSSPWLLSASLIVGAAFLLACLAPMLMKLNLTLERPLTRPDFGAAYRFASIAFLYSMFVMGLAFFVRLVGAQLTNEEDLGRYAIVFRIGSIAVVMYQFLWVIFYRKIYQSTGRETNYWLATSWAVVAISQALVLIVFLALLEELQYEPVLALLNRSELIVQVLLFCILWTSLAMTEALVVRDGLCIASMKINLPVCASFVVICLLLLQTMQAKVSIELLTSLHSVLTGIVVLVNCHLLKRRGSQVGGFAKLNAGTVAIVIITTALPLPFS